MTTKDPATLSYPLTANIPTLPGYSHEAAGYSQIDSGEGDVGALLWHHEVVIPAAPEPSPFHEIDGGVEIDQDKMEIGRPYPYRLDGTWFVAVRHSKKAGDVDIYHYSRER